ncbi:hypothetical protein [Bacillus sp. FJAT-45037]|uniref:hypothetical protein n=1 Tax=Bacillus sp. FJAT-45037 TaxID=2011007 RepID=UPI0012FD693D|nr:hypothetical protein [Bacillus sp. FJAT-45037]
MKEHKLTGSMYDEEGVNAVHDQVMNAYYAGTNETHSKQPQKNQQNDQEESSNEEQLS